MCLESTYVVETQGKGNKHFPPHRCEISHRHTEKTAFGPLVPVVLSGCKVGGPSLTPPGSSLTQLDAIYLALEH